MKLFVYGTLKSKCCNHYILKKMIADQVPVSVSTIEKYPMYKSPSYFPYLENQPGLGEIIVGQVVDVSDDNIIDLDRFEGVPNLYKRGTIMVTDGNESFECLCYFKAVESTKFSNPFISNWIEEGR